MKVVLVIGTFATQRLAGVVPQAMTLADAARKEGDVVWAPCLDRRHSCTVTDISEIRGLEKEAIVRKFPDEVRFTDPAASDVADLVVLARQYGYRVPA